MSKLINKICKKIILKKNDIFIIGIDGPTAAGKTILAEKLEKKLKNFKCFTIKMDWTLKSRSYREKSLKEYNIHNREFLYEAEEHMSLNIISNLLEKIQKFNKNKKLKSLNISLNKLYNREKTAKNDLKIKKKINKKYIIIVEGHYTGYHSICKYIDLNLLLLASKKELLKRKINRVKGYRNPSQTKKYFELIDIPSFINFISRYGNNYEMIIDNTNYYNPEIKNHLYIKKWVRKVDKIDKYRKSNLKYNNLHNQIKFNKIDELDTKNFDQIFNFVEKLDKFTIMNFGLAVKDINISTANFIKTNLFSINKKLKNIKIDFVYTNNFHNLYFKKFPILSGFRIINKENNKTISNFIVYINESSVKFVLYWNGGVEEIFKNRKINFKYLDQNIYEYKKLNITDFDFKNFNKFRNYIPTDFTNINICDSKESSNTILTDREETNINSFQILSEFFDTNIFWVQRFAKFSERNFFSEILNNIGATTFSINNYLFAIKSIDEKNVRKFRLFFDNWNLDNKLIEQRNVDNITYDQIIDKQREFLEKEVKLKTKNFKVLDGKIFYIPNDRKLKNIKNLQKDLQFLLNHNERIVRKSIVNFLISNVYNLNLETSKLWPNDKDIPKKNISLNDFTKISPTILSDLYFWLNLKRQKSSILASNIYDIRKNSFDISAYLKAAQEENTPIVLQSSFNSIGQAEKYKNKIYNGYLRLPDGPKDFVHNTLAEARKLFLNTGKDFLFGIGIDHLDFRHNIPKGRIYRFLKKCQMTKNLTHYTLDSSFLLEDKSIKNFKKNKNKIVKKIIKNEIELLKRIKDNHIYDFEYCANELNYIENEKKVFLPNHKDINFFAEEFSNQIIANNINYINSRPKLIIGNLGTVHHGVDKNNYVKTEVSEKWINYTQKFNFISAVLHGTSRSHPEVLKRATAGCMKINVAGDLLQILVGNLPDNLKNVVIDKNDEDKKKLYLIRNRMDSLSFLQKKKIFSALYCKSKDLIKLINSPNLTDNDKEYFKYKLYNFDYNQSLYISKLASERLFNYNLIPKKKNSKKIKKQFLMSPIELEYGNFFKKIVKIFNKYNLNEFHLDVGDGQFISRVLDVTDKIKFIKKLSKKNKIHLHLMVKNPNKNFQNDLSYIEHYAKLDVDYIGLHRRSFKDNLNFENSIKRIIRLKKEPTIFLEIDETFDHDVVSMIHKYNIKKITFMGVPLGYGGQFFKLDVIPNIESAINYIKKNNLNVKIEVDGGINFEILEQLKNLNIKYFAGWSIIKSNDEKIVEKKLNQVINILK